MLTAIFMLLAILILAALTWRRPADPTIQQDPRARWLLYLGLLVLGLYAAFYLVFAVGESLGGDPSGLAHLAPAFLLVLLIYLAHRRPVESGWVLLGLGLVTAIYTLIPYFLIPVEGGGAGSVFSPAILITAAPLLLAGLLLLAAAWVARGT